MKPPLGTPESDARHVAGLLLQALNAVGGDRGKAARVLRLRARHYSIAAAVVENPGASVKEVLEALHSMTEGELGAARAALEEAVLEGTPGEAS